MVREISLPLVDPFLKERHRSKRKGVNKNVSSEIKNLYNAVGSNNQ